MRRLASSVSGANDDHIILFVARRSIHSLFPNAECGEYLAENIVNERLTSYLAQPLKRCMHADECYFLGEPLFYGINRFPKRRFRLNDKPVMPGVREYSITFTQCCAAAQ